LEIYFEKYLAGVLTGRRNTQYVCHVLPPPAVCQECAGNFERLLVAYRQPLKLLKLKVFSLLAGNPACARSIAESVFCPPSATNQRELHRTWA